MFTASDVLRGGPYYIEATYALANLRDEKASIQRFRDSLRWLDMSDDTPKYPYYSDRKLLRFRDELRLLWYEAASRSQPGLNDFEIPKLAIPVYLKWRRCHETTREAIGLTLEEYVCNHWLEIEPVQLVVRWRGFGVWYDDAEDPDEKPVWGPPCYYHLTATRHCLSLMLAQTCVLNARNLKLCSNPECSAPFFIGTSRQRYCNNDDCVRWAQKLHKRNWWAMKGSEQRTAKRRGKRK